MRMLGRRCPDDISVVGHNDMPLVDLVSPPLTTVRIEHREMGRGAAGTRPRRSRRWGCEQDRTDRL